MLVLNRQWFQCSLLSVLRGFSEWAARFVRHIVKTEGALSWLGYLLSETALYRTLFILPAATVRAERQDKHDVSRQLQAAPTLGTHNPERGPKSGKRTQKNPKTKPGKGTRYPTVGTLAGLSTMNKPSGRKERFKPEWLGWWRPALANAWVRLCESGGACNRGGRHSAAILR